MRRPLDLVFLVLASTVALGVACDPAHPPTAFAISGTVTGAGAGVTMTLGGGATATTATDASGAYRFAALPNGAYTVTPSLGGFTFTPASASVTVQGADVTGKDFTATARTRTVHAIASGGGFSCALVDAGVQCWGGNGQGQLGDGTTTVRQVPVQVSGLSSGVTTITANNGHACAIVNGGVQCWGMNDGGQLGDGTTTNRSAPVPVPGLSSGVTVLAAGWSHTCAALSDGGARCWGYNDAGQLGNGSTTGSLVPVPVDGLSGAVLAMAAGKFHTCALLAGGAVRCWGDSGQGQLGTGEASAGSSVPIQVPGLATGVTAISAGGMHTCAVVSGGVRCWGGNDFGQIGDGSTSNALSTTLVSGLSTGVSDLGIGSGWYHSCAVLVGGGMKCWGNNEYGGLGNGSSTTSPVSTPVQVSGLTSASGGVNGGWGHSCAIVSGGVQCWGLNSSGQLGNDSRTDSHAPVPVSGL